MLGTCSFRKERFHGPEQLCELRAHARNALELGNARASHLANASLQLLHVAVGNCRASDESHDGGWRLTDTLAVGKVAQGVSNAMLHVRADLAADSLLDLLRDGRQRKPTPSPRASPRATP